MNPFLLRDATCITAA